MEKRMNEPKVVDIDKQGGWLVRENNPLLSAHV
jgi:hypothetical protein